MGTPLKRVLPAILEDEGDGFAEIRACFFGCAPLPIRSGNLGAVSDEPLILVLDDGGEFVVHG